MSFFLYFCIAVELLNIVLNGLTMNRISVTYILLACLFVLSGCAKQGFPSGGPKDETPPVVLSTTPPNGTLNFSAKEFLINFDEYVNVKDAENNIFVSPVMAKKPEYSTKGRSLVVKLKDTLLADATYLFQFKEAIVDFNESNALPSYEYVFSTSGSIDSMTLRGKVVDAFSSTPRTETITVAAYAESQLSDTLGDSVVAKVQPMYMTRCDKEGNFALNHLRAGRYLLLAIEDGDKNLRLTGDEAVAFLDTLVTAVKMPPAPDTSALDSTSAPDSLSKTTETLVPDSSALAPNTLPPTADIPSILMRISQDKKKEIQRIARSEFLSKSRIEIVTKVPLSRNYSLSRIPCDTSAPYPRLYHKLRPKGDTLDVWVGAKGCDSITLLLKDTTGLNDTLRLQQRQSPGKKSNLPAPSSLKKSNSNILKSLVANSHPYFDTLWLAFNNPVEGICDPWRQDSLALLSAVSVMALKDSTITRCGIHLLPDSSLLPAAGMKAFLDFEGKPGEKYSFTLPDSLFYDIYRTPNDSLTFTTEYTKTDSYGNIFITLLFADSAAVRAKDADTTRSATVPRNFIIQLTNERGDIVRQQTVSQPGKLSFLHLKGGKYSFRAIVDRDQNNQWTPGNYWLQRQPEEIILFGKTLDLRENWDMEEKWVLTPEH